MTSPGLLLARQLEVLFVRDAGARLVSTRDPAPRPAPRVFLGRSADANVWALHRDVAPRLAAELGRLLAAEPATAGDGCEPPHCRSRVCALLGAVAHEHRGPAFILGDDPPRDDRAREIGVHDLPEVIPVFPWLAQELEAVAPVVVAFAGGEPAAVCHAARGMTSFAAEAGVETRERFRGRGLGTAAVSAWARAVQRRGRVALYSTAWENAASRGIARRLGARPYGENWHVT